ncbi:hypothetical protein E6P09_00915 [Haloferax mediterranei ATCC 33500]|uniref:Uncharacterized protein n=1 Tax=Haloferax mediterranei (strain ATCC 33500 / DSM 1411 / JCM 8866 / NBRC 14739 / NCIMB 2177 / R-4) TaxID=523841 RepID=M0ISH4_HALMT|nr:hypothetical protein BM92_11525 [Haloferax mediterranei ATCC 33500]ELZ99811.1 hypothetical protein C439_12584 [Haloferax mediterranei ATCC 33500]QCQ73911.1 hypothetical protein E6P09_00915 [Haloferax mediterranei ATCC 33500]
MSLIRRVWWNLPPSARIALFAITTFGALSFIALGSVAYQFQLLTPEEWSLLAVPLLVSGMYICGLTIYIKWAIPSSGTSD